MATRNVPGSYATIKAAIAAASPGDTIKVAAGTYTEQLLIQKNLILEGAGSGSTIVRAPLASGMATAPLYGPGYDQVDGMGYVLAAYPAAYANGDPAISVKITGFAFDDGAQAGPGSRNTGVYFRKVAGATAADAGLFDCIVNAFTDAEASGVWVMDGSRLTIHGNTFNECAEYGVYVLGKYADQGANTDPFVVTSGNTFNASGADKITYRNVSDATLAGTVSGNIVNNAGANNGICIAVSDHVVVDGNNRVSGAGASGIWLEGASDCTIGSNSVSGATSEGIGLDVGSSNNKLLSNSLASCAIGINNISGAGNVAHQNRIAGNAIGAQGGASPLNAENNWWGAKTGPNTTGADTVSGDVDFTPWLTGSYEVDPISRIEGHLGVKVSVGGGVITEANAHGNLWRGFENFLIGRRVNDAITFTQRICGVCPVPHGLTSTYAADSVMGVSQGYITFAQTSPTSDGVPPAAVLVRNMILASEFLMSSITHFYHLAAQSYVQGPAIPPWTPFFENDQYHALLRNPEGAQAVPQMVGEHPANLWSAVILQYVKALRIRRLCLEAGALFAGRMPMTSAYIAGGTTNFFRDQADFNRKCDQFRDLIEEVGKFVITEYIPLSLALGALYPEWDNENNITPISIGATRGKGYGKGVGNFLAWGGFPGIDPDGTLAIKGGYKHADDSAIHPLLTKRADLGDAKLAVEANLKEFIARSRYANTHGYEAGDEAYPGSVTATEPKRDDDAKYSWLKAPRWGGQPMEVGPLARMVVNGLYPIDGTNVVTPYAGVYVDHGGLDYTNPFVVHPDLVAGLAADQGGFTDSAVLLAVKEWIEKLKGGMSTMDRLRARAIESFWMVNYLIGSYDPQTGEFASTGGWVGELKGLWTTAAPKFFRDTEPPLNEVVHGYGLTEAPRGALGHFVTASGGKIVSYQCVVPTTWNGSPKDGPDSGLGADPASNNGTTKRGPIEQAMIGVPFDEGAVVLSGGENRQSGVEVLRVAQSFDPCIACAVH